MGEGDGLGGGGVVEWSRDENITYLKSAQFA